MKRFLLLLLVAVPLHATLTSSAITGRVTAGDGPLGGATVTVSSAVLQHPRTTLTGPRGTYWIGALPPGEYDVTFSRSGMTTVIHRAILQLGLVTRSDAALEPSADEESVTSTAKQIDVAATTAITSHFDDTTLDLLPGRDYAAVLAPDPSTPYVADLDGAPPFLPEPGAPEDAIEQVTLVRAAAPVEHDAYAGKLFALRTRSGTENYFVTLRDTLSSDGWNDGGPFQRDEGLQNLFELLGGGRIVSQRLWFFASLWSGTDATRSSVDDRGILLKLNGQPGASHHLDAHYSTGERSAFSSVESSSLLLRHTGVFGPRVTTEAIVSRTSAAITFSSPGLPPPPRPDEQVDFLSARASWVLPAAHGDHVLTGGVTAWEARELDAHSFFAGDRWSAARWVVNAGIRYDDLGFGEDRITPRVAVTYDLRGNGRHAIAASYGEYALAPSSSPAVKVAALGYAFAIGMSGTGRADIVRRDEPFGPDTTGLQLDARYRLFDRLDLGGSYTYMRYDEDSEFALPHHQANAWGGVRIPLGSQELSVTLLQRFIQFNAFSTVTGPTSETVAPTDFALRYAIPVSRVRVTFATDVANVFAVDDNAVARTIRFWTRLQM